MFARGAAQGVALKFASRATTGVAVATGVATAAAYWGPDAIQYNWGVGSIELGDIIPIWASGRALVNLYNSCH
jgi:hypothetical protein